MNHDGIKDIQFILSNGIDCVIRNVPYYNNGEAEESFDMSTAFLLAYIKQLMSKGDISYDVDYQKVKDLE